MLLCFLGSSSQRAACVSAILLLRMCGHCKARSCVGFLAPLHGAKAVHCEGDARCRFGCLAVVNRRTVCVSSCVRRLLRAERWLSLWQRIAVLYTRIFFAAVVASHFSGEKCVSYLCEVVQRSKICKEECFTRVSLRVRVMSLRPLCQFLEHLGFSPLRYTAVRIISIS